MNLGNAPSISVASLLYGIPSRKARSRRSPVFDRPRLLGEHKEGKRRQGLKKFRFQALIIAGFLLLTPLAPLSGANSAAQAKAKSTEQAQPKKQEKRVRGRWDMADGQIKNVTCKGHAMNMTFYDYSETLHLYAKDYFKVKFSAINFTPKGIMNPCKTTKGMYARVYYYHIKGHPHQGDLISVELRK